MSLHIPFDNSFARLPPAFFAAQNPQPVKAPRLVAWNAALARLLGLPEDPIDAHSVQPYYTLLLARESGMEIGVRATAEEIVLTAAKNKA